MRLTYIRRDIHTYIHTYKKGREGKGKEEEEKGMEGKEMETYSGGHTALDGWFTSWTVSQDSFSMGIFVKDAPSAMSRK